jgi:small-conductance mechanosensitive channel
MHKFQDFLSGAAARAIPPLLEPVQDAVERSGALAPKIAGAALALAICALVAFLVVKGLARVTHRIVERTPFDADDRAFAALRRPGQVFLWLLLFEPTLQFLGLPDDVQARLDKACSALLTFAAFWLAIRAAVVFFEFLLHRLTGEDIDEQRRRALTTRLVILQRVTLVGLVVVGASLFLMQFQVVRNLGVSLLASAGIASVVVGVAAQKSIGNLVAGVQIAITQPIRVGDTVIVEQEFGKVEELTLTYAVIRLWDLRQLILPVTYFLEKPFQNWTRSTPNLVGSVFVQADFGVPVDAMRAEVRRLCEASERWDGVICRLHVTDAAERMITLRATVSAHDADHVFDLRCEVREGLVAWLQTYEGGKYLPHVRLQPPARPDA